MFDKDFCLNSYIAFRYLWKDDVDFFEGMHHENFVMPSGDELIKIGTVGDIDSSIRKQIDVVYEQCKTVGVLLSGGMDSAIVASYLRPGSHAYTFTNNETNIYSPDIERAKYYCKKLGLVHHLIDISFDDYKKYTPIVMDRKCAPVHSIEPQIYKAAIEAKKDGVEIMLIGDGADYVFGGMDKLLSKDWTFDAFVKRYISLDPKLVLTKPEDITGIFEPYRRGKLIDFQAFMAGPTTIESYSSYENAFNAAEMPYLDPYDRMKMIKELDLNRIRNGESKYMIRELFKERYPELDIPEKIPMPRPVDKIFESWSGPTRSEFREDIPMKDLTGNQKWQLWCAEDFLNRYDKTK